MRLLSTTVVSLLLLLSAMPALAAEVVVFALFKDFAVLTVDGERYKLRKGESTPEGIVLISANSEEAILSINGKEESYPLGSSASVTIGGSGSPEGEPQAEEVRIYPSNGMYLTVGSINGHPVNLLVDTGATYVAMNENTAKKLGIDYRLIGQPGVASTASGQVRTWEVVLSKVKVGGIELTNVEGAVIEGSSPTEVLLGMSFLGRTRMLRDRGMLLLQKKW